MHLKAFLQGASAAQRVQVMMIRSVFEMMDSDKDGVLSMSDVRSYFRTVGRNASDLAVRKWISARDIDQDGVVSLTEFVASFAMQLDPASKALDKENRVITTSGSSASTVAAAFGALRLSGNIHEVIAACDAAIEYIQRIIDSPGVKPFWSIAIAEESFHKRIGRLFGGVKLMHALGFSLESNGSILALRDAHGSTWDVVPHDVLQELLRRLEELRSHRNSLLEPTISNVAAGKQRLALLYAHAVFAFPTRLRFDS